MFVACLLAACNQVYGLDPTIARDAFEPILDDDKDRVADDRDNCLGVANADQSDLDADGKGDACDACAFCLPCATGPEHDEDGDRVADGCDNCPAVANDQSNSDGDDLGDACDPSAAVHRRILFDGFATLSTDWLPAGGPWNVVGDAVGPATPVAGTLYGLEHASVRIPQGTTWFVEVGVASPPSLAQGVALTSGLSMLRCEITPTAGGYRLNNSGIVGTSFPFPPTARLRYAAEGPIDSQDPDCQLLTVTSRQQGVVYQLGYPLRFSMVVTGAGRFTYVDVIGP